MADFLELRLVVFFVARILFGNFGKLGLQVGLFFQQFFLYFLEIFFVHMFACSVTLRLYNASREISIARKSLLLCGMLTVCVNRVEGVDKRMRTSYHR